MFHSTGKPTQLRLGPVASYPVWQPPGNKRNASLNPECLNTINGYVTRCGRTASSQTSSSISYMIVLKRVKGKVITSVRTSIFWFSYRAFSIRSWGSTIGYRSGTRVRPDQNVYKMSQDSDKLPNDISQQSAEHPTSYHGYPQDWDENQGQIHYGQNHFDHGLERIPRAVLCRAGCVGCILQIDVLGWPRVSEESSRRTYISCKYTVIPVWYLRHRQ